MIHEIVLTIDEICKWIPDDSDQKLTRSILEMFGKYDLTYKIRTDDERLRIYCYIKKSKETLAGNAGTVERSMFFHIRELNTKNAACCVTILHFTDSARRIAM